MCLMQHTEDAKTLHHRREEMRVLIAAHHAEFRGADGGILPDLLEPANCPVCESNEHRELFVKNGGRYVICKACTMVYLNPCLTDAALLRYYSSNTTVQAISHVLERDFYENVYRSGLGLIGSHQDVGNVLDVGCSSGLFLDVARDAGWLTYGTELNDAELRLAVENGHQVHRGLIDELPAGLKFDLITLWDVFEHLKDGARFLMAARERLNDGGLLFLQIPNSGSYAARLLQEKCNMFDGIEHVCLYSDRTIRLLATVSGWSVVGVRSVLDELKPVRNFLNYEHPYQGSFRFADDVPVPDPADIHDRMLGYKLQIVMRPA